MFTHTRALKGSLSLAATAAAFFFPSLGHGAYFKWEMVELPAASGASCGNGTPYRFFMNRTPNTANTIVIFEGGGACYEKNACLYKSGFLGAINPNGIPKDYMTNYLPSLPNDAGTKIGVFNSALKGNITPFATRMNSSKVQTQNWNIVYAPYCTGDVYTGNRVATYTEKDGSAPLTYHHKGLVNAEAMVDWLAANAQRPDKLLVYGFSAGGVGATANYAYVREKLQPRSSSLLADSGPLFNALPEASPQTAPSKPLYDTVRQAWGIDSDNGIVSRLLQRYPGVEVDPRNLAVINVALAQVFPNDRLGFTMTQTDKLFSSFAYDDFFPEIRAAATIVERDRIRVAKWQQDISGWVQLMQQYPNVGYYLPYSRETVLKSHTTTMLTLNDTGIPEAGINGISVFVDNLIDGTGNVPKVVEAPVQKRLSPTDKFVVWLQDKIFSSLGL